MKKFLATIMVLVFVLACMPVALADISKYGDVDGNDTINIFDATAIQNHIAKAVLLSDDMAVGACEIPNAPGRYAVVQLFWAS